MRERLIRRRCAAHLPRKSSLYHMGDTGHEVYFLRSGLVKLVGLSSSAVERIVGLVDAGHMLGLETLARAPFRHTAIAMSDIECCSVPAEDVRGAGSARSELRDQLLREFQSRLNSAGTFLAELSTDPVQARVARLMLFLAKRRDQDEFPLISREDMAMLLGCTTETASRVVAEFKRKGLVRVLDERGTRCRYDIGRLREIAVGLIPASSAAA